MDVLLSALRIEDMKSFLRLHITEAGDLEVFSIGVDKVPRYWEQDREWDGLRKLDTPSYLWEKPSRWVPLPGERDMEQVSIVDKFIIRRERGRSARRLSDPFHRDYSATHDVT